MLFLVSDSASLDIGFVSAHGAAELLTQGPILASHATSSLFLVPLLGLRPSVVIAPSSSVVSKMPQTMRSDANPSVSYSLHGSYFLTFGLDPMDFLLAALRFCLNSMIDWVSDFGRLNSLVNAS